MTTVEAMLLTKALASDLGNEIDNDMAKRLYERIKESVGYDLKDYRCNNCVHYKIGRYRKNRGECKVRSGYGYTDIRYGRTKACKKYFEEKEGEQK